MMLSEPCKYVHDFCQQNDIRIAAPSDRYLVDETYRVRTTALAIAQPQTTEQVQTLVCFATQHQIPLVPQGGNSNRTVAALPEFGDTAIILSMEKMCAKPQLAHDHESLTVEAGCTLIQVQEAAEDAGKIFGVDLGARNWCQIGGNISTNAGGMHCMRYGNMREQVLGLEVVTPDGTCLNMMNSLKKNNVGYDLKQLFIGAEGTLGVITRAVLRLYPRPIFLRSAALACRCYEDALEVLKRAQKHWQQRLIRIEFLGTEAQKLAAKAVGGCQTPFAELPEIMLLLEVSDLPEMTPMAEWLTDLSEENLIVDALPAESPQLERDLWTLRERCGAGLSSCTGPQVKHDIAVPVAQQPAFLHAAKIALAKEFPLAQDFPFGHWGDGNIHYNVYFPAGPPQNFTQISEQIHRLIEDIIVGYGGTFSAEHGIGSVKKSALLRYTDPATLVMMKQLKHTLDPQGIMNPGKIFD